MKKKKKASQIHYSVDDVYSFGGQEACRDYMDFYTRLTRIIQHRKF